MEFSKKYTRWLQLLLFCGLSLLVYWFSIHYYFRIDLTKEQQYSLSENTYDFLETLSDDYEAEIYLSGELPYGFQKLQQATVEIIEELDGASPQKITCELREVDTQNPDEIAQLTHRGLSYTSVNIKDKKGRLTQQLLFPSLILHNEEKEVVVPLLHNNSKLSGQENLNQSIANLEYEITNGLRMLERKELSKVAFLEGQGELEASQTIDFAKSLSENYEVQRISASELSQNIAALIIAQPREDFSENDKFAIDQYIMHGGKTLWLIDEVQVFKDSLRAKQVATAFFKPLNIEDQLFSYGVRINPQLVLDKNADLVKINTALKGQQPRFTPLPWGYEPLLETNPYHPITKGLSPVRAVFANSIDTLASKTIDATPLLRTSTATRLESVPKLIRMAEIENMQDPAFYPLSNITVGVLLEGKFPSIFKGRLAHTQRKDFSKESIPTQMIVVADGDIIRNETRGIGAAMQFQPLGYNADYQYTHGNKTFLLNAIDFLCVEDGWLALRNKEYTPAVLSKSKARAERTFWQILNVALPLLLTFFVGFGYALYRKRKYAQ